MMVVVLAGVVPVERVYATEVYMTNNMDVLVDVMYADLVLKGGNEEFYKECIKEVSNKVRSDLGIDNMIGLIRAKNNSTGNDVVMVHIFPIKAEKDLFIDIFFDKYRNEFYTLV